VDIGFPSRGKGARLKFVMNSRAHLYPKKRDFHLIVSFIPSSELRRRELMIRSNFRTIVDQ
jgi:hypothetical protein